MKILLVLYDNSSYTTFFPMGLAAVAAVLRQIDIEPTIWDQDINHYPDEQLTEYLDKNYFDAVCISVIGGYWQYRKLLSLSKAIEASKQRPKYYVIGGYGPAPEPEYFLKKTKADIVVLGEGEETTRELFPILAESGDFTKVRGIAYRDESGDVKQTFPRQLIDDINDWNKVPMPAFDLFNIPVYRMYHSKRCEKTDFTMPVLSGRGCTFKCNFCYRMDKGFRPRSPESILEEVELLQTDYGITYIMFSDDLLMTSRDRTLELAEGFIKYQEKTGKKFNWNCNGRLNYCTPEILKTMERAGCVFINYGIEAMDNQVLKNMKKGLNTDTIIRGVEETLKTSISPGLNFIWGNHGDTKETLQKAVDFLLKYDDGAQMRTIRPVTPYPGSPLYFDAINMGLIDKENPCEDFYENKHTNSDLLAVNFTQYSDEEFHAALYDANCQLLFNYFDNKLNNYLSQTEELYLAKHDKDFEFRGFRQGQQEGFKSTSNASINNNTIKHSLLEKLIDSSGILENLEKNNLSKAAIIEKLNSGKLFAHNTDTHETQGDGRSLGIGGAY